MKKLVILLVLLVNISIVDAQNFRFGFQVSPGISWMKSNSKLISSNGNHINLKLGMIGEYYFRDNYSIISGIGFNFNYGGKLKYDIAGNFLANSELSKPELDNPEGVWPKGTVINYKIQYVEIPIGLKMTTNEFGYFRYYAEIPVFTLNIRSKSTADILSDQTYSSDSENIRQDVHFLNMSWGLGGGVEYLIGDKTTLVGGIFYQHGFFDITRNRHNFTINDAGEASKEDSRATFGDFTVKLGILF